jgi:hypothetical protein
VTFRGATLGSTGTSFFRAGCCAAAIGVERLCGVDPFGIRRLELSRVRQVLSDRLSGLLRSSTAMQQAIATPVPIFGQQNFDQAIEIR